MLVGKNNHNPGRYRMYIYGEFHKWGYPNMDGFIRENPTNIDDLGVPLFQETPILADAAGQLDLIVCVLGRFGLSRQIGHISVFIMFPANNSLEINQQTCSLQPGRLPGVDVRLPDFDPS